MQIMQMQRVKVKVEVVCMVPCVCLFKLEASYYLIIKCNTSKRKMVVHC